MERICTTKSTSHKAEATNSPTSQSSAGNAIPALTVSERSNLTCQKCNQPRTSDFHSKGDPDYRKYYHEFVAKPALTESEKSRLYVIKREVGRKYAVTMHDLQFLVEVIERCGL